MRTGPPNHPTIGRGLFGDVAFRRLIAAGYRERQPDFQWQNTLGPRPGDDARPDSTVSSGRFFPCAGGGDFYNLFG